MIYKRPVLVRDENYHNKFVGLDQQSSLHYWILLEGGNYGD